jgi:hypothetical protein
MTAQGAALHCSVYVNWVAAGHGAAVTFKVRAVQCTPHAYTVQLLHQCGIESLAAQSVCKANYHRKPV